MIFLLDENISFDTIGLIESLGHKVLHIKLLGKAGIRNGEVHKLAVKKKAWIITRDTDFLNRAKIKEYKTKGVIVVQLTNSKTTFLNMRIKDFFAKQTAQLKKRKLTVIEDKFFAFYN